MLSKFASMFMANNSEVIFKVKSEMQDFLIPGYASVNFTMSTLKLIVVLLIPNSVTGLKNLYFALNFLNTFLCRYANVKMLFLLRLVSLSIFLSNLIASLGLSVVVINCSKPLASISSLLLISESRSFSYTCSLLNLGYFLFSSKPKN